MVMGARAGGWQPRQEMACQGCMIRAGDWECVTGTMHTLQMSSAPGKLCLLGLVLSLLCGSQYVAEPLYTPASSPLKWNEKTPWQHQPIIHHFCSLSTSGGRVKNYISQWPLQFGCGHVTGSHQ